MILLEWLAFCSTFLNIHRSGILTALAWLVPHEPAAIQAQVLCTPYNHAPCYFMQSHIRKVYAYLAVTCHLDFWKSDWDLLCATVVTQGWNGHRNKSQQWKLTLEKKIREENSPAAPAGIWTHNLSIMSLALLPLSYPTPPLFQCQSQSETEWGQEHLRRTNKQGS